MYVAAVAAGGEVPIGEQVLVDIDFLVNTPKESGGWFGKPKVEWVGERGNGVCIMTEKKGWGEGMGSTKTICVTYQNGQPIFPKEWLHQGKLASNGQTVPVLVDIDFAADLEATEDALRGRDERAATKAAKAKYKNFEMPEGYTWHHLNVDKNGKGQMLLVKTAVHKSFGHAGAFSVWREIQKARAAKDAGHLSKMVTHSKRFVTGTLAKGAARYGGPIGLLLLIPVFVEGAEADGVKGGAAEVGRLYVFADEIESLTAAAAYPIGDWFTVTSANFKKGVYDKQGYGAVDDMLPENFRRLEVDFKQFYKEHYRPYNPVE